MSIEPRRPSFPWSVSLGNVLQILVTVVAVAVAYANLDLRSKSNGDRLTALEALDPASVAALEAARAEAAAAVAAVELRVRTLEERWARSDERLANALLLLTRIDDRLERIETDLRNP